MEEERDWKIFFFENKTIIDLEIDFITKAEHHYYTLLIEMWQRKKQQRRIFRNVRKKEWQDSNVLPIMTNEIHTNPLLHDAWNKKKRHKNKCSLLAPWPLEFKVMPRWRYMSQFDISCLDEGMLCLMVKWDCILVVK